MILFGGDSHTWGQGLEWEVLLHSENWDVDRINNLIPPQHANENLPLFLNEYRKTRRWIHQVAHYYNYGYDTFRLGNGGGNYDTYFGMENLERIVIPENVNLIVHQFTQSGRGAAEDFDSSETGDLFEDDVQSFIRAVKHIEENFPWIKIISLSWLHETGQLVEKYLGEKYVVKHDTWDNKVGFETWLNKNNLAQKYQGLKDYHMCQEQHDVMAKIVINHIEKYKLLEKNKFSV